ncbi:uncharacterized protein LOC141600896 [Silene latifolia]|uniref:uncharacterized protein LOC141600896 n=1 Tax=Silene latifolia TaxID=37657 RepID=UPI003D7811E3
MTAFCWNCRGFGETDDPTIPYLHHCIRKFHPAILFLQETHSTVTVAAMKTSHLGFPNFCGVDSLGRSGGLFLCWDDSVDISVLCTDTRFIFCKLSIEAPPCTKKSMFVMFIYGEPALAYRCVVWERFSEVISGHSPFLIIGDFNQVELHCDKLGGSPTIRGQDEFLAWKLQNELIDVPFFGPRFTWTNSQKNADCIFEKLDRAYATQDWFQIFPNASLLHLPILISDHAPIILRFSQFATPSK